MLAQLCFFFSLQRRLYKSEMTDRQLRESNVLIFFDIIRVVLFSRVHYFRREVANLSSALLLSHIFNRWARRQNAQVT